MAKMFLVLIFFGGSLVVFGKTDTNIGPNVDKKTRYQKIMTRFLMTAGVLRDYRICFSKNLVSLQYSELVKQYRSLRNTRKFLQRDLEKNKLIIRSISMQIRGLDLLRQVNRFCLNRAMSRSCKIATQLKLPSSYQKTCRKMPTFIGEIYCYYATSIYRKPNYPKGKCFESGWRI